MSILNIILGSAELPMYLEQTRVQALDAAALDSFGYSVALSSDGNTMAVGRTGAANRIYALYVFVRSGTTWTEQARIQATSNMGSYFGTSVSLSADGNTLAASAYGETSADATKAGAAYIYVRSGTTWTQQARVQALPPVASSQFGYSVALSLDGNTLAVGANLTVGSAYVFVRSGTTWSQQARMEALDGASNNYFGNSVALTSDGNTLAVGAQMAANSGGSTAGSAYIFTRAGSTWSPSQLRIQAFDAAQGDQFGASITLSADGSMVAVGSPSDAEAQYCKNTAPRFGCERSLETYMNDVSRDHTAENGGFEPPRAFTQHAFQACAIGH